MTGNIAAALRQNAVMIAADREVQTPLGSSRAA